MELDSFWGVAEMIGRVDFDKDMDFWQLDMWNGFFPGKWLLLRHQWEISLPIQVRYGIQNMVQNKPLLKNSFYYTVLGSCS
jgi:hypothetical protein